MIQTVDFRFELLFILLVLVTGIALISTLALALVGRRPAASRLLKFLAAGWAIYLLIVFLVAAVTPQRVVPMTSDLCSDEMCFAVVNVQTSKHLVSQGAPMPSAGEYFIVTVRVANHGRGRTQSERGLYALLWSPEREYQVSPAGQTAWDQAHPENEALTARVPAGGSVLSDLVFDAAPRDSNLGLVLRNGFTPGYFVIGECPLFHKPTVLRLSR